MANPPVRDLNTPAIDAACECLRKGDYDAVKRIVKGTLPRLSSDAYKQRIRIYMLLMALPDHPIDQDIQEDSLRVARHVFAHREAFSQRYRLWAHMIFGALKGEWTVDSEKHEFFALQDAQEVLAHPESSREDRDLALTLIASESPDDDQVRLCLEELLDGGNAFAITQAVTSAKISFHRATDLIYLDRALDRVKSPSGFVADLLHKKMATVLRELEEDTESEVLDRKDIHTKLVMCYAHLRMMPGELFQQAYSEYYLAYAAACMDETELGLIHAYTALAMARRLGDSHLEQLALAVRDHFKSRAPYEGKEPDEEKDTE
ncbi:hypothetical protein HYZ98_01320 [Candidatus Peregrinibacteria bacterium]|nr:hypothetical protein [Candidatus Peregrinibacteria bacterium]